MSYKPSVVRLSSMDPSPLHFRNNVSVDHSFSETRFAEHPHRRVLVAKFSGVSGHGCANNGDAKYMSAMTTAAIFLWSPSAVLFDLRELEYEWGDLMAEVLDIPACHRLPATAIISDLNKIGLTSLVSSELGMDPNEILFDSWDTAMERLHSDFHRNQYQ